MTAVSFDLSAHPGGRPEVLARLPYQVSAVILLSASVALAPRLHNAPVDLAPMWLGAGVATLLSLHLDTWLATLLLATVMAFGGAVARAQDLPVPAAGVLAAMALVTALQARFSARLTRRVLGRVLLDPHRSPPEQLRLGVSFLLGCVLVPALLAGMAMAVLQAGTSGSAMTPRAAAELGLLYAAASGLGTSLLTPLWARTAWLLPSRVVAGLLWLVSAGLAWLAHGNPQALYLAPLIALAAGGLGGMRLVALCVSTLAASLMLGVNLARLSPFEGPGGFVVMLLFVWRLVVMGFFVSVWTERRRHARVAGIGRAGALLCRDAEQLLRHFHADGPALIDEDWRHGWVRIDLGAAETAFHDAGVPLLSVRLHAAMRAVGQVLRPGDGVMPQANETVLILLPKLASEHLHTVAARMTAALGRELGEVAPANRVVETRVFSGPAVQFMLQSQAYFALDID